MVEFSDISLPFGIGELLNSSMGLLGLLGGFLLLVLALNFAPSIIKAIFYTIETNRSDTSKEDLEYVKNITTPSQYKRYVRRGNMMVFRNEFKRQRNGEGFYK